MSELVAGSALFTFIILALTGAVLGARALLWPQRPCTVTLNAHRQLPARTYQRLLTVLTDAGVEIPSSCGGAGTCGLCRVKLLRGGGEPSPTELGRLGRAAAAAGMRLACQVAIRGDLSVQVPDEILGVQHWSCTVRSVRTLAPFMAEVVLDLPQGAELDFHAGAFVQLTVPAYRMTFRQIEVSPEHRAAWERYGLRELTAGTPRPVARAYSLANRPQDKGQLVLDVRLALPPPGTDHPPGVASSYLFGVKPGTKLEVTGPYGSFAVNDSEREMVFIGGGAGMAPMRAMIFDQLERVHTRRKISFWYGARNRVDLVYLDEFEKLQTEHDNFSWTAALSDPRPQDAWNGATGFIHHVVRARYLEAHPAPEQCEYYLCGPPLMTQAVFAMLDELGVPRENIFNDDFGN